MLHAESSEDCGDIGFLSETDSGIIAVDFDAEELACGAKVGDLVLLWELRFDFDRGFGSSLRIWHGDIFDIQKYENTVAAEIEVGIGWGLCEPKRE
jgi:hypothetical protein